MRWFKLICLAPALFPSAAIADELSDLYAALALNTGRVVSVETRNHVYEVFWDDATLTFSLRKDSAPVTDIIMVGDMAPITFTAINTGNTPEVNGSAAKSSSNMFSLSFSFRPASNYIYNVMINLDLTEPVSSAPVEITESAFAEKCKCVTTSGQDSCLNLECDSGALCASNKGTCRWVQTLVVNQ